MNVRFTEHCRDAYLEFEEAERKVQFVRINDGRSKRELALTCTKDIHIGVFFDGTNNNKYRDTLSFSQSNVERLYEVYPGTPARQQEPVFKPRVNPDGSKTERPVFPDSAFKASSVPAEDYPYYRKIYVPGLGTPMPDTGDSGTGTQKSGGLATALLGQVRLDWALLQLVNQIHAAVFQIPLDASVDMRRLYHRTHRPASDISAASMLPGLMVAQITIDALQAQLRQLHAEFARTTGTYTTSAFNELLDTYVKRLGDALAARGDRQPRLRKIRLSVFGFSRGAAQARAWVNMITNRWGDALAGLPLQIDFLGIFDTVASVGLAQSTPYFEGHGAWAHEGHMAVPGSVKRCVHLVAALEVRGSFPLDSVCQGGTLPPNCKEIVYPGVHSDVGGGYPPGDQGRCLGPGAAGDRLKLSQIALAQMYREARMAGVPLAPETAMTDFKRNAFAIAPQLRDDFNAYIAATRTGSVPPTQGRGEPVFASMYPTETQPREELHRVMRRHYGFMLRWRKAVMNRAGGMAGMPGVMLSGSTSRHQDAEDIRGAEQELRQEILFLQNPDPKKFDHVDDPSIDLLLGWADRIHRHTRLMPSPPAQLVANLSLLMAVGGRKALRDVMKDKQHQWDTWLHQEWASHSAQALPPAAERLFEHYVHDSRAWFKPFMRTDVQRMVPDDEEWFTFGGRERERARRMRELRETMEQARQSGDLAGIAASERALSLIQQEGQPLLVGGREPYRMWGYVRHRCIFQAGRRTSMHDSAQARIEREEQERVIEDRRQRAIADEQAQHTQEREKLKQESRRVNLDPARSQTQKDAYNEATRAKMERLTRAHERRLRELGVSSHMPAVTP